MNGQIVQTYNCTPIASHQHILKNSNFILEKIPYLFTIWSKIKGVKSAMIILIDTVLQDENPAESDSVG